jgi:hypothetical protein
MMKPLYFYLPQLLRLLADVCQDTTVNIEDVAINSIRGMRSQEDSGAT